MDYEGINDDTMESFTSDSVQWQGSQTPCAALDSLLSEAAFKPQTEFPGVFKIVSDTLEHSTHNSHRVHHLCRREQRVFQSIDFQTITIALICDRVELKQTKIIYLYVFLASHID
jgi:hypothetical protein